MKTGCKIKMIESQIDVIRANKYDKNNITTKK